MKNSLSLTKKKEKESYAAYKFAVYCHRYKNRKGKKILTVPCRAETWNKSIDIGSVKKDTPSVPPKVLDFYRPAVQHREYISIWRYDLRTRRTRERLMAKRRTQFLVEPAPSLMGLKNSTTRGSARCRLWDNARRGVLQKQTRTLRQNNNLTDDII